MFLVTEEIYAGRHGSRHNFRVDLVKQSDLPDIRSQGVFAFTVEHWKALNVRELTYNDYFLACDEQEYTTFLNFIARLHVINSPSYMAVAQDGRLFLADIMAMVYSPTDSQADSPAQNEVQRLLDYLQDHQRMFKDLQAVTVSGPQGTHVSTYLATQTQLRKLMRALERACRETESPISNLNWAVRISNYAKFKFPGICKAALDLCIEACKIREFNADNEREGLAATHDGSDIRVFGNLASPPKHMLYTALSHIYDRTHVPTNRDEYVICSIRSRIDSDMCGHHEWQRFGNGSHDIGFDCTIRAGEAGHMKKLCSEIRRLFNGDLILHRDAQRNSGPILRTASSILFCLRELDLIQDDNFDQENLSIVGLCKTNYYVWPVFTQAWSGRVLIQLHEFLMKPNGQSQSYNQEAEISISKLVVVSITCCAIAILHEAHYWKGRESSVLEAHMFLRNSHLGVPEASMVVNVVLKELWTADLHLFEAVLGTTKEIYAKKSFGVGLKAVTDRHPLIVSNTPDAINARKRPPCSCVVCVTVATTQFHGTWRTDLIRSNLVDALPNLGLIREPWNGAVELLSALAMSRSVFVSQRNINYVLHNASEADAEETRMRLSNITTVEASSLRADPLPYESNRGIRAYYQQFEYDNSAPSETKDEVIEAYWNSDSEDAVDRVRQAMIIGAQSTNIDMATYPLFDAGADWARYSGDGSANTVRHATFTWPGWLCEMVVREAHEHIPAGTAHWAAVRAVNLAEAEEGTTHVDEAEKDPTEILQTRRATSGRNKSSILQPHPGYKWPLQRTPKPDEIVLIDVQEKQRVCMTLEEIAELKPPPLFASHIWETPWHPDPTGRQLSQILGWQKSGYIWLDYLCLPQGARTEEEDARFKRTLGCLSALQSCMDTKTIQDEYDKRDWERRGWTIVEALIGDVPSPFSQAVFRHFQQHGFLKDIFLRLRICVTNEGDISVLESVLREWIGLLKAKSSEEEVLSAVPLTAFSLVRSAPVPPNHQELESAKAAARRHREVELEDLLAHTRLVSER
jgi:hypothetical protein